MTSFYNIAASATSYGFLNWLLNRVEAVLYHQLVVLAALNDLAVVERQDHVYVDDGGKAACNGGTAFEQLIEGLLDKDMEWE